MWVSSCGGVIFLDLFDKFDIIWNLIQDICWSCTIIIFGPSMIWYPAIICTSIWYNAIALSIHVFEYNMSIAESADGRIIWRQMRLGPLLAYSIITSNNVDGTSKLRFIDNKNILLSHVCQTYSILNNRECVYKSNRCMYSHIQKFPNGGYF